jgi:hypothetical protein
MANKLTDVQIADAIKRYNELGVELTQGDNKTDELQRQMAEELSSQAKRDVFCQYMTETFTRDKGLVQRLQNCINKPATQRYFFKLKKNETLEEVISVRQADKGLLDKKIATQTQVDKKGVYHFFRYAKPAPKTLTVVQKINKILAGHNITKEQYDSDVSKKLAFHETVA